MNIKPGSDEIKRIAKEGRYKIAPVCCEIMSDFILSPLTIYARRSS